MNEIEALWQKVGLAIDAAQDDWLRQEGDARDGMDSHPELTLPQAMGKAAIQAIRESDEAAGMVTVPREPTEAMLIAGGQTIENTMAHYHRYELAIFKAMLAAYKPEPPQ